MFEGLNIQLQETPTLDSDSVTWRVRTWEKCFKNFEAQLSQWLHGNARDVCGLHAVVHLSISDGREHASVFCELSLLLTV